VTTVCAAFCTCWAADVDVLLISVLRFEGRALLFWLISRLRVWFAFVTRHFVAAIPGSIQHLLHWRGACACLLVVIRLPVSMKTLRVAGGRKYYFSIVLVDRRAVFLYMAFQLLQFVALYYHL